MRILSADVGGTKTLLALYEGPAGALRETRRERYDSRAAPSLSPLLARFLEGVGPVDAAGLGVAGPVEDRVCRTTNLPWVVDAAALEAAHAIGPVALLNDFEAVARGLGALAETQLLTLSAGEPDPDAPAVVLGAGTGLGVAILLPTPSGPRVLPTEGGHADFAPRDGLEIALQRALSAEHGRVSAEHVLSGRGLGAVYRAVLAARGEAPAVAIEARLVAGEDPGRVIGEAGIEGVDAAAVEAVRRFAAIYGAEAGNLALRTLPFGGLYVAGGIAPKIRAALEEAFMPAFLDKAPMRWLLERIPVRVVLDPSVGLLGAREAAARALGELSI